MEGGSNGSRQFYKGWLYLLCTMFARIFSEFQPGNVNKISQKTRLAERGVFLCLANVFLKKESI